MDYKENVFAVILAGDQETHLWPIGRRSRPEQFLDLSGNGRSMLQETFQRAALLTGSIERVLVITGMEQEEWVSDQLSDLPQANIILEPIDRNTAPSLGLAAFQISNLSELQRDAIMISLPVEHLLKDEESWFLAVRTAVQSAAQEDALVTIGLEPNVPVTGYGYQQLGERVDSKSPLQVFQVLNFIEKPTQEVAQGFLDSGQYLWNTGTYAWKVSVFLSVLKIHTPALFEGLKLLGNPPDMKKLEEVYPMHENISIGHIVMEKAVNVLTVRSNFERIDIGSMDSLSEIWDKDENGNTGFGEYISLESKGNIVYNDEGLVTLLGIKDLVVIRTAGVILVCPKDRIQEIISLAGELPGKGLENYL
ncbi:mannose-1-phosphate guanylyltransferase [Chloroflexota bacterium]